MFTWHLHTFLGEMSIHFSANFLIGFFVNYWILRILYRFQTHTPGGLQVLLCPSLQLVPPFFSQRSFQSSWNQHPACFHSWIMFPAPHLRVLHWSRSSSVFPKAFCPYTEVWRMLASIPPLFFIWGVKLSLCLFWTQNSHCSNPRAISPAQVFSFHWTVFQKLWGNIHSKNVHFSDCQCATE